MVTKTLLMIQMLALAVLSLLLLTPSSFGLRLHLTRVDAKLNLTKLELHRRAIQRSKLRVASLASTMASVDSIQSTVRRDSGEFLMDITVGQPPVPMSVVADTGSDLVWIKSSAQCSNHLTYSRSCSSSYSTLACGQTECIPAPLFQCSSTQDNLCYYNYTYGDGSSTQGVLSSETFTFGSNSPVSVPRIIFGCSSSAQGTGMNIPGLAGLGYGKKSLVYQLGAGKFSYCLTSPDNQSKTSPILFGSAAVLDGAVQSTPLRSENGNPSYFLRLKGITVGNRQIVASSQVSQSNEDGGFIIIDSGTTLTTLENGIFQPFLQAVEDQLELQFIDRPDTDFIAFSLPSSSEEVAQVLNNIPRLVFSFEGAEMDLTQNYLSYHSESNSLLLMMMGTNQPLSILGNHQQQNMHILYDLDGGKLYFVRAQCSELVE